MISCPWHQIAYIAVLAHITVLYCIYCVGSIGLSHLILIVCTETLVFSLGWTIPLSKANRFEVNLVLNFSAVYPLHVKQTFPWDLRRQ